MAEYIDRAELISNLKEFANEQLTPLIENLIQKQPTADVVEVVRCKDCRHRGNSDICPMFHLCYSVSEGYYWEDFTMDNAFCRYAKRRAVIRNDAKS